MACAWRHDRFGDGPPRVLVPNGEYFADDLATIWTRHPAVVYDLRNRGASEPVADPARLERGVLNDVDDLEAVRRQVGVDRVDLIAHSYVGVVAALYAMRYPQRVGRLVMLSPAPADLTTHPPPPPDETMRRVFGGLGAMQQAPPPGDAEARCQAFWALFGEITSPTRRWRRASLAGDAAINPTSGRSWPTGKRTLRRRWRASR